MSDSVTNQRESAEAAAMRLARENLELGRLLHKLMGSGGLTLRDYFAAQAPPMPEQWWEDSKGDGEHYADAEASWRYFFADAMLRQRDPAEPARDGHSFGLPVCRNCGQPDDPMMRGLRCPAHDARAPRGGGEAA